ncbi:MAG: hypothetical protein GEV10_07715 [Streptosporangiales bacterium]|nr:hypothetical protein [Streptosporangiales bacterium]
MTMHPGVRAAIVALATALLVAPAGLAHASESSPIELSATPDRQEILAGLPCLPAPPVTLGMTNTGDEAVYADTFLRADRPLELSRAMFSSYVPAGTTVTAPLTVEAPYGTEPGRYDVTLDSAGQDLVVPITVTAPPARAPGDNLLLGEQADPSSTYVTAETAFDPCGAVDGDHAWSTSAAWSSDTFGEFPDTYTVTLPEPAWMNRLDMYTHETQGLSAWDVRVETSDGAWRTVAEVRGNTAAFVSSTFPDVEAAKVEIVALDSVDHGLSRIREIEAYLGGPPPAG